MQNNALTLIVEVSMPARQQVRFQNILQGEDGLAVVRCFDPEKKRMQLWTVPAQKEELYDWLAGLPKSLELQLLREWLWDEAAESD